MCLMVGVIGGYWGLICILMLKYLSVCEVMHKQRVLCIFITDFTMLTNAVNVQNQPRLVGI
jgi:succinate-acetate transporter protein